MLRFSLIYLQIIAWFWIDTIAFFLKTIMQWLAQTIRDCFFGVYFYHVKSQCVYKNYPGGYFVKAIFFKHARCKPRFRSLVYKRINISLCFWGSNLNVVFNFNSLKFFIIKPWWNYRIQLPVILLLLIKWMKSYHELAFE